MNGATHGAEAFRRDRLTWLAYLFLAYYGYFLNIFGPITPFLKDELALTYTVSSLHTTAFAVGILVAGLFGHLLIRRTGRWFALWIGAFGISAGAFALILGRSPLVTVSASLAMGLVGSLILVVVPSVLSDRHGEQRAVALAEANVIASLVATSAPLIVGLCVGSAGGWRAALALPALAPFLMALLFRGARPVDAGRDGETTRPAARPLPGAYWVFWVALVLAVSVEFCMIFWSADYLETRHGVPVVRSAQAVSLFLGGMILGRLGGSRLVRRIPPGAVVIGSILLAAAGFVLFWLAQAPVAVMVGLFVAGLGVASLYPLILSLAIGTAPDQAVQASTRGTLASGTAILALPLALGRMADLAGIQLAYGIVALLLVALMAIMLASVRTSVSAAS